MILFIEQAQFYVAYHQNPVTKYLQMVSIPLIILSLMILLGFVRIIIPGVVDISLATIATFALLCYYLRLHWRLALMVTPLFIFLLWVSNLFSYAGPSRTALWTFLITLILGCGLQFAGSFVEGKRVPIVVTLWQILIAPLVMVADVVFIAGRMPDLKKDIYGKG